MQSNQTVKWVIAVAVLFVLAVGGYVATTVLPVEASDQMVTLEFDVAEDMNRFVFDEAPVFEDDGYPAYGNAFMTQGFIYPKGTLNGSNGVIVDDEGNVLPEFPDKVIGEWTCRGYFVGDAAHAESGPWVITTQVYNFGEEYGHSTIVTDGYEPADIGVPINRAITGGTGEYSRINGQAEQIFLGLNASEGVNLTFSLEVEQQAAPKPAS